MEIVVETEKKPQCELNRVKKKIQKEAGIIFHKFYYDKAKDKHVVTGVFSHKGEKKYIVILLCKDKELFEALIERAIENINKLEEQNS